MSHENEKDMCSVCMEIVRERDYARYLATLLAPKDVRTSLFALYAFDLELRFIAGRVSNLLTGQMRLQWWRDVLASGAYGGISGNPVMDLLQNTIELNQLPYRKLKSVIDAHDFDIGETLFSSLDELMTYLDLTFTSFTECACLILTRNKILSSSLAVRYAGRVGGLIWVLSSLPYHLSVGKFYLPEDMLTKYALDIHNLSSWKGSDSLYAIVDELIQIAEQNLEKLNECLAIDDPVVFPAFSHLAPSRIQFRLLRKFCYFLHPYSFLPSPLRVQWLIWRFRSFSYF
ncbi:MAG: squalene/phytoene synthase family protein [Alphaproteobacteria bacterium]|nr:squalene/phytoene synthase family protein [Alphaproteobacteria bacterium]